MTTTPETYEENIIKKINAFVSNAPEGEGTLDEQFIIDYLKALLPYFGVDAPESYEIDGNSGIKAGKKGIIFLEGIFTEDNTPEESEGKNTPYYREWYVLRNNEIVPHAFKFSDWRSAIYYLTNLRVPEKHSSVSYGQKTMSDYA